MGGARMRRGSRARKLAQDVKTIEARAVQRLIDLAHEHGCVAGIVKQLAYRGKTRCRTVTQPPASSTAYHGTCSHATLARKLLLES